MRMRHAEFMTSSQSAFTEQNRGFVRRVSRWFWPHIKAGHLKNLPRDLYVAVLLGPGQEFARQWLAGRARTEPNEAAQALARVAWQSLRTED
jgi:hypothetical protein